MENKIKDNNFTTDIVIGLEIHIELDTESKLFCSCSTRSKEPNDTTCETCLGFPGSKPLLNKKAVDHAIKLCLATNSKIFPELIFSRKNYFYPDMSKNYQITQYEIPLGKDGHITLSNNKKIDLERIHIEEDPASLVHPNGIGKSSSTLIDYSRSGRPLCEMVTKPVLYSPVDAREFLKQLINILQYLNIFDIENGTIKADANISIKESDYTRVEIKNISGFKEIEKALYYEISRQKELVKNNEKIKVETRLWDATNEITKSMRDKEGEADYGYILDPDLVVTEITDDWIKKIKKDMPELPIERKKRYINKLRLSQSDAEVLTLDYKLSEFFEKIIKNKIDPVLTARWVRRDLTRVLNYNEMEFSDIPFSDSDFIDLLNLIQEKKITENVAKKILEKIIIKPFNIIEYIRSENLESVNDNNKLKEICIETIKENQKAVDDYKAGNEKSLNFIVGQVMRKTKGTATPDIVLDIIKKNI